MVANSFDQLKFDFAEKRKTLLRSNPEYVWTWYHTDLAVLGLDLSMREALNAISAEISAVAPLGGHCYTERDERS